MSEQTLLHTATVSVERPTEGAPFLTTFPRRVAVAGAPEAAREAVAPDLATPRAVQPERQPRGAPGALRAFRPAGWVTRFDRARDDVFDRGRGWSGGRAGHQPEILTTRSLLMSERTMIHTALLPGGRAASTGRAIAEAVGRLLAGRGLSSAQAPARPRGPLLLRPPADYARRREPFLGRRL